MYLSLTFNLGRVRWRNSRWGLGSLLASLFSGVGWDVRGMAALGWRLSLKFDWDHAVWMILVHGACKKLFFET